MAVVLAPHYTQRTYQWTQWKVQQAKKLGVYQVDDDGNFYTVYFYDGPEVILCQIWKGVVPDSCLVSYSQEQNDIDKAEFETRYALDAGKTINVTTPDGRLRVAHEKSTASRYTAYSHDWTDKTTWYSNSVYVMTESLTFADEKYQLAHADVIDTYHGKITGEDFIKDYNNKSFRVALTASGTMLTEQNPHYGTGGDYVVDYDSGSILPVTSSVYYSGSFDGFASPVKATYHYATDSTFVLKPAPGKNLVISLAECQFSLDVEMNDSIVFQPYGLVEVFAPQYCPVPYPRGTLIPLGNPSKYKSMSDFFNESNKAYVAYPAIGGSSWRGSAQPTVILNWDYVSAQTLKSSHGMEVRVKLEHDTPFGGYFATATFYCISEDS